MISKIELGVREMTSENARILADFFGVSIDYLLDRESPPTVEKIVAEAPLPLTVNRIITALPNLTNMEIARIMGACESVLNQRTLDKTKNGNGTTIEKKEERKDAA
jgi:transcriptional regulator with XRE-family HTH domain